MLINLNSNAFSKLNEFVKIAWNNNEYSIRNWFFLRLIYSLIEEQISLSIKHFLFSSFHYVAIGDVVPFSFRGRRYCWWSFALAACIGSDSWIGRWGWRRIITITSLKSIFFKPIPLKRLLEPSFLFISLIEFCFAALWQKFPSWIIGWQVWSHLWINNRHQICNFLFMGNIFDGRAIPKYLPWHKQHNDPRTFLLSVQRFHIMSRLIYVDTDARSEVFSLWMRRTVPNPKPMGTKHVWSFYGTCNVDQLGIALNVK